MLREQLGFKGIIFSDDLTMEGAAVMGNVAERAQKSLAAGCDMVLVCNQRDAQVEVLDTLPISQVPKAKGLVKKQSFKLDELRRSQEWKNASEAIKYISD